MCLIDFCTSRGTQTLHSTVASCKQDSAEDINKQMGICRDTLHLVEAAAVDCGITIDEAVRVSGPGEDAYIGNEDNSDCKDSSDDIRSLSAKPLRGLSWGFHGPNVYGDDVLIDAHF